MGVFNKIINAVIPKMIKTAVSAAVTLAKGTKPKKTTKGKRKAVSPKEKAIARKQKTISKKKKKIIQQVCQSAYGTYIRGVTTVAARYIGHPAAAIPASKMIKKVMEENAPTVNYLVQLKAESKKENNVKNQKKGNIVEYAKKGAEYVEGYYDSYWKALKGERVIDEKYTLENLFSGKLTIEDIPDFPEFINMLGATRGALQRGAWNSVKGTFDTVKVLVTEPGQVLETISSGVSDFVEHPWESTKKFVGETVDGFVDAVWRSTPQDMAEDVGEIAGDIAVDALTAGTGAAITTGLKTGAKKLTVRAGKTVTKTVAKTTGKTVIKEAGKKTIKEMIPDTKTIRRLMPKELPNNKGWLKNVVTAGGDINVLKKNHYQAILPDGKNSVQNALQKTGKNTAKEMAENKAVDLTKDKIVNETKEKVIDEVKDKVIKETKEKVVDEAKNKAKDIVEDKINDTIESKTETTIQKVKRESSGKTGDGVQTSAAVNETKVDKVKTTEVEGNKLKENGTQTKAGKEIGKEITKETAEKIEKELTEQTRENLVKANNIINTSIHNLGLGERVPISSLNKRQRELLQQLRKPGSTAIIRKKSVSMNDLRQLTNVTGDEFNMFTRGGKRLIIRGKGNQISVSEEMFDDLKKGVYGKFSGHTHPAGHSLEPGPSDEPFLKALGQSRSSVWGNTGEGWLAFGDAAWSTSQVREQIRREKMAKFYENL